MNRHRHRNRFNAGNDPRDPQGAGKARGRDYTNVTLRELRFESPEASELFMDLRYFNKGFAGSTDSAIRLPAVAESVSTTASSGGMVYRAFPHGLWYGDQAALMGGMGLLIGLMMSGAIASFVMSDWVIFDFRQTNPFIAALFTLAFLVLIPMTALAVLNDVASYRFSKSVLFDRNSQKVHLLTYRLSLAGKFKSELRTFDWQCVRAEVDAMHVFTGTVGRREIGLRCLVMDSPGGEQVVEQFSLGINMPAHLVQPLLDTWEHVRRFMQREGPLFSSEEDAPNPELDRQPFWRYLWTFPKLMLGVVRDFYVAAWQDKSLMALCFALAGTAATPIILPLLLIFGLLPWICSLTKREPKWPAEILASVGGNPLSANDLAAWRSVIPDPNLAPPPGLQALPR